MMAGRLDKDPQRKTRAEAIKAVTDREWSQRPGAKLEKEARRAGDKLIISRPPEYILDADGEVIGVDAWVQLFDAKGRELPIDPHRRIINPPTVPRAGVRLVGEGENQVRELTPDPLAAFWEAVLDSVEGAPNAAGWRTRGTVTTVFGDTADGTVRSVNATYATARTGGALTALTGNTSEDGRVGQFNNTGAGGFFCYESFFSFDTSAISDTDQVSAVVLDLDIKARDVSGSDFTAEARDYDWGASVTTGDWISGAALSQTLVASVTASSGSVGSYQTFSSDAAFLTVTNLKTGTVRLVVNSSRHRLGNSPGASPSNDHITYNVADATGTTDDPKLTITHAAALAPPPFYSRPNRIWRLG